MADITENQQSEVVRISNPSEDSFAGVSSEGDLNTVDFIKTSGVEGALSVGLTALEVKVGASALANRKSVTVYNNSSQTIYWGYTSGVTVSTGTPIFKKEFMTFRISDQATLYLISNSTSLDVRITEAY